MRKLTTGLMAVAILGMMALNSPALAGKVLGTSEDLIAAFTDGHGGVNLRYRLEFVDQDGFDKDGVASTLQTYIYYQTMQFRHLDLFLKASNVSNIGGDTYNNKGVGSNANGFTDRPVVADPSVAMMKEAWIRYSNEKAEALLGRQDLRYDNVRFIGNVGWRQNVQVFDSFRLNLHPSARLDLRYTYVDRVHRITGAQQDLMGHLINASVDLDEFGSLGGYGYILDFEDADALSTSTFGGFLTGKRKFNDDSPWMFNWRAEYAIQQETGDNPNSIDTNYMHLKGGVGEARGMVTVGFEQLAGDATDGQFTTTFATLHKFNGWADKFLGTPTEGLKDFYVGVNGAVQRVKYGVTFHDFSAESSDAKYGTEIDGIVSLKTRWGPTVAAKAAAYTADNDAPMIGGYNVDVTKFWFFTSWGF